MESDGSEKSSNNSVTEEREEEMEENNAQGGGDNTEGGGGGVEEKEMEEKKNEEEVDPEKKLEPRQLAKEDASVLVQFHTKQKQFAVPGSSVSVRVRSKPKDLNEIIRAFINQSSVEERELPEFDFLVQGQILAGGLIQLLEELEIGFEQLIKIEYMKRLPPPTPKDSLQHDDWVAAVQCSPEWLLTGCYDNTVHLWDVAGLARGEGEGAHRLTIPAHMAPVKSVTWVHTKGPTKMFISTSIDQTAVVWVWHSKKNTVECVCECRGHTQSVECVAVYREGKMFATGSWDNTIKLWSLKKLLSPGFLGGGGGPLAGSEAGDEESEPKKRKAYKPSKMSAEMTLSGHTENVSGVAWTDDLEMVTSSWDHSIRLWDVELGGVKNQMVGNSAFFSLSWSPLNRMVLASCADRHIRLYDPRIETGVMVQGKYTSHTKWVPSVRWSTTREHLFVSGGYDSTIKEWDRRSPNVPLYDLKGHEDKVLAVDWSNPKYIVSGGADCTAKVFNTNIS